MRQTGCTDQDITARYSVIISSVGLNQVSKVEKRGTGGAQNNYNMWNILHSTKWTISFRSDLDRHSHDPNLGEQGLHKSTEL
jgi:hypothetical protein